MKTLIFALAVAASPAADKTGAFGLPTNPSYCMFRRK